MHNLNVSLPTEALASHDFYESRKSKTGAAGAVDQESAYPPRHHHLHHTKTNASSASPLDKRSAAGAAMCCMACWQTCSQSSGGYRDGYCEAMSRAPVPPMMSPSARLAAQRTALSGPAAALSVLASPPEA